jgi:hypothetical protein
MKTLKNIFALISFNLSCFILFFNTPNEVIKSLLFLLNLSSGIILSFLILVALERLYLRYINFKKVNS